MSTLSYQTIVRHLRDGVIGIDPAPEQVQLQPCSVDLRLGWERYVYERDGSHTLESSKAFMLRPGVFVLASTLERVRVPSHLRGQLMGRSTLARQGLVVHQTGGFIDPGWDGVITLELSCVHPAGVLLLAEMRVCQIEFTTLDEPTERPYGSAGLGSKYQGSSSVEPARPDRQG